MVEEDVTDLLFATVPLKNNNKNQVGLAWRNFGSFEMVWWEWEYQVLAKNARTKK